ncbi:MAG: hypothetical protein ACJ74U_08785 [Jatrophihabitantaceae bacterium]
MPDCAHCLELWAPRLPELSGQVRLLGAIAHPECPAHGERVPVRSLGFSGRVSRLRRGFVKATFAVRPRAAGAPWVGVVLADLPRSLPAAPVISGMGVHTRRDAAIEIATAEAVERYGVLLSRSPARPRDRAAEPAARPTGTAVAVTHRTAVRRAVAECLERLAIQRLCADGSAASAEPSPAGGSTAGLTRALAGLGLVGEVYTATVLAGCWLCVVALVDAGGTLVAVGTAGAGSPQVARRRAVFEAYGLWAASAQSLPSPVTEADQRLLASLRAASGSRLPMPYACRPMLFEARPAMSTTDIGTRLSDECGLHAVQVTVVA